MLADELDAPVHIHLHENAEEVATSKSTHGATPIARLDAIGLLTPRLQAVHMTAVDAPDLERMATRGAAVVHCPQSNLKLGNGHCRLVDFLAAGIRVGLGTDGAASGNDLDLFDEAHTAALLAKATTRDAGTMPAHTVLELATLGGARALGLDQQIGSVEPGKSADLIAIDMSGAGAVPVHRPESTLLYGGAGRLVNHVWIDGRQIMHARTLTTLDERAIVDRARIWAQRLAGNS
ncbi:MAG: amidohydrolase family protein [Gammaproteobacteria bacterium]|nr:amidohydrolase family protein [Gammaproteobacteria bacterium]